MDKLLKRPISLLEGAERNIEELHSSITTYSSKDAQPLKLDDYLVNVANVEKVLKQLILKLRSDVDKLWICDENEGGAKSSEVLENNVTAMLKKQLWGEKETVLSCLVKLVGLLDKMLALEKELSSIKQDQQVGRQGKESLSKDDQAIIERYFQSKYSKEKGERHEIATE